MPSQVHSEPGHAEPRRAQPRTKPSVVKPKVRTTHHFVCLSLPGHQFVHLLLQLRNLLLLELVILVELSVLIRFSFCAIRALPRRARRARRTRQPLAVLAVLAVFAVLAWSARSTGSTILALNARQAIDAVIPRLASRAVLTRSTVLACASMPKHERSTRRLTELTAAAMRSECGPTVLRRKRAGWG